MEATSSPRFSFPAVNCAVGPTQTSRLRPFMAASQGRSCRPPRRPGPPRNSHPQHPLTGGFFRLSAPGWALTRALPKPLHFGTAGVAFCRSKQRKQTGRAVPKQAAVPGRGTPPGVPKPGGPVSAPSASSTAGRQMRGRRDEGRAFGGPNSAVCGKTYETSSPVAAGETLHRAALGTWLLCCSPAAAAPARHAAARLPACLPAPRLQAGLSSDTPARCRGQDRAASLKRRGTALPSWRTGAGILKGE